MNAKMRLPRFRSQDIANPGRRRYGVFARVGDCARDVIQPEVPPTLLRHSEFNQQRSKIALIVFGERSFEPDLCADDRFRSGVLLSCVFFLAVSLPFALMRRASSALRKSINRCSMMPFSAAAWLGLEEPLKLLLPARRVCSASMARLSGVFAKYSVLCI